MKPLRLEIRRELRHRRAAHGRTLIELLIAMVLSLMIIAAVGTLYSISSNTSRTSQQLGGAEERGRLAMYFMGEPIALAGFGNINSGSVVGSRFASVALQGPHLRVCTSGRFLDPMNGDFTCVPSPVVGDQLYLSYQAESLNGLAPQGAMTDCLGQNAPVVNGVATIQNLYSIEQTASGALEFSCRGNGNAARQGLVRDVEDFKVYVAFDSRSHALSVGGGYNPTVRPSTLLTATQLVALPGANDDPASQGNPWNHVIAVYVCLQVRTAEAGTTPDGVSRFRPCPQTEVEAATGTAEISVNDGIARRSYTQVFTIRARAQAGAGSLLQ
jgi:Tfp pilus assembly protein PilW